MEINDLNRIVYSINVEDLQTVAESSLGRELSVEEIQIIEDKLGDYFDWFGTIENVIGEIFRIEVENLTDELSE